MLDYILNPRYFIFQRFLANNFPEKLNWLYRFSDEIFAIVDAALEFHYLQVSRGLFAEQFYNLQRKPSDAKSYKSSKSLTLFVHTLLPYLKTKLFRLYEKVVINGESTPLPFLTRNVIQLFQNFSDLSYHGINLAFSLMYIIGISR